MRFSVDRYTTFDINSLVFGYLADKFGRRPTLLGGYIGFFIATLLVLRTDNIVYFLLLRFLQGASGAAFQVMMRCSFRDLFSGIELSKVSGYYSTIWALVPILAPALGGYIQHYFDWQMHFKIMLGLCAFLFILTWKLLPETKNNKTHPAKTPFLLALNQHLQNRTLLLFTLMVALADAIILTYIAIAPFLLQIQFSISPVTFGWLTLIVVAFSMLGAFITGKFVDKIGNRYLIISMSSIMLLTIIITLSLNLLNSHNLYYILMPMAVIFFCNGALYPAAAGKAYMEIKTNIGIGVALYGTIFISFAGACIGIVSLLPHTSLIPFMVFALFANSLIILLIIYLRGKL